MATTTSNAPLTLSTLDKGLRVLETLAAPEAAEGLTLTELALRLGMHRTTLFRFLVTLRERGYVERDANTERYRLGVSVLTLATSLLNNLDLRRIAWPILRDLRDSTRELVHLAVMQQDWVVTVERIEGTRSLSLQTGVGDRRPAYCTASGKAMLAYLPAAEVERMLAAGMPRLTPRTITTPAAMWRELAAIRERGFAVDDEERTEGIRCVAAPVYGADGTPQGALSLAAPTLRFEWERVVAVGAEVARAAAEVSRRLGYRGRREYGNDATIGGDGAAARRASGSRRSE